MNYNLVNLFNCNIFIYIHKNVEFAQMSCFNIVFMHSIRSINRVYDNDVKPILTAYS